MKTKILKSLIVLLFIILTIISSILFLYLKSYIGAIINLIFLILIGILSIIVHLSYENRIKKMKKKNKILIKKNKNLNKKITILTRENLNHETNNFAFVNILENIKEETSRIKNNIFQKILKKPELIIHSINMINSYADKIIKSLNLKIYSKNMLSREPLNYDIYLIKKERLLFIVKNGKKFKFELSNVLFMLLELLVQRLIEDFNSKPLEERGFVEKKEIEQKIFDGIEDSNRFYANNSRLKKMIKNSGLNPNIIENREKYYRINTISNNIYIFDDIKQFEKIIII